VVYSPVWRTPPPTRPLRCVIRFVFPSSVFCLFDTAPSQIQTDGLSVGLQASPKVLHLCVVRSPPKSSDPARRPAAFPDRPRHRQSKWPSRRRWFPTQPRSVETKPAVSRILITTWEMGGTFEMRVLISGYLVWTGKSKAVPRTDTLNFTAAPDSHTSVDIFLRANISKPISICWWEAAFSALKNVSTYQWTIPIYHFGYYRMTTARLYVFQIIFLTLPGKDAVCWGKLLTFYFSLNFSLKRYLSERLWNVGIFEGRSRI